MKSKIMIDPQTGLPQLPEGYFWRVGESEYHKEYVKVCIMKTVTRTWKTREWNLKLVDNYETKEVEVDYSFCSRVGIDNNTLLRAAERAYREVFPDPVVGGEEYLGDYPPKKLSTVKEPAFKW